MSWPLVALIRDHQALVVHLPYGPQTANVGLSTGVESLCVELDDMLNVVSPLGEMMTLVV